MEEILKTKDAKIVIVFWIFLYTLFAVQFCYNLGKLNNIVESAISSISTLIPIFLIQIGSFIILQNKKNKK